MTEHSTGKDKTEYSCQIMVITHKPYEMPKDAIYVPLQVGAALRKKSSLVPTYARDDTGENISRKNPYYCELTGLYWAWKNCSADYIGLVHYRRHFRTKHFVLSRNPLDKVLTGRELQPMLGRYKVFVPRRRYYLIETLYTHYEHTHYVEHLEKTRQIIQEKCPEYLETYDEVMKHRSAHMFNMMIMERSLLDEYCTWLFDILFELEKQVDTKSYSYFQGRYCGRVGELIFNVWLEYQQKSGRLSGKDIKVLPYLYIEKVNWWQKGKKFLRAKFFRVKYE
ncbi:MAG: DUF4422 domain-containing protein [Lachnospiraceae bacterium]